MYSRYRSPLWLIGLEEDVEASDSFQLEGAFSTCRVAALGTVQQSASRPRISWRYIPQGFGVRQLVHARPVRNVVPHVGSAGLADCVCDCECTGV